MEGDRVAGAVGQSTFERRAVLYGDAVAEQDDAVEGEYVADLVLGEIRRIRSCQEPSVPDPYRPGPFVGTLYEPVPSAVVSASVVRGSSTTSAPASTASTTNVTKIEATDPRNARRVDTRSCCGWTRTCFSVPTPPSVSRLRAAT